MKMKKSNSVFTLLLLSVISLTSCSNSLGSKLFKTIPEGKSSVTLASEDLPNNINISSYLMMFDDKTANFSNELSADKFSSRIRLEALELKDDYLYSEIKFVFDYSVKSIVNVPHKYQLPSQPFSNNWQVIVENKTVKSYKPLNSLLDPNLKFYTNFVDFQLRKLFLDIDAFFILHDVPFMFK